MMLIPAKVQSVVKAATRVPSRFAFNAVCLERKNGRCVATATDGRVLLSAMWDDEQARKVFPGDGDAATPKADGFSALVDMDHWNSAFSFVPRLQRDPDNVKHLLCDERGANGSLTLSTAGPASARIEEPSIEGTFPDWRGSVPQYSDDDSVTIGVNPFFLAKILTAIAKCATTVQSKGVRLIVPKEAGRPILIEADDGEGVTAVGVVMPVRLEKVVQ